MRPFDQKGEVPLERQRTKGRKPNQLSLHCVSLPKAVSSDTFPVVAMEAFQII